MGDKFEGNIKNSRSLARLLPFSFFTVFAADYVTKQIALEVVGGRCAGFIGIHHTDHPALVVEVNDFLRRTYFTVIFVRSAFIDQSAGLVFTLTVPCYKSFHFLLIRIKTKELRI